MKVEEVKDGMRLCFKGKLTVNNVAALRRDILAALAQSDQVEFDMDGVTAVDLSGLQLLCSAHRTAAAEGKSMTVKDKLVPALQEACTAAGFVFHRSCRFNSTADCFWVGGKEG